MASCYAKHHQAIEDIIHGSIGDQQFQVISCVAGKQFQGSLLGQNWKQNLNKNQKLETKSEKKNRKKNFKNEKIVT